MITERQKDVGIIRLNRPEKLNALTLDDIHQMSAVLEEWAADETISWVLLEGEGRAFCAGGDVVALYRYSMETGQFPDPFFRDEFALDRQVHHFPKPVVSLYKGVTMGGGVGLTVNADLRITDETLVWAMPETRLGFMPDVAMGWYLSQLPQADGLYLSLLGGQLDWQDALYYGFADLGIKSQDRAAVRSALLAVEAEGLDYDGLVEQLQAAVAPYRQVPGVGPYRREIAPQAARYFKADHLGVLMEGLQASHEPFATEALAGLLSRSPLAVAMTFLKYFYGKKWTRDETFAVDLHLLAYLWEKEEPLEAIRAAMVDKNYRPSYWRTSFGDLDWPGLHALFSAMPVEG